MIRACCPANLFFGPKFMKKLIVGKKYRIVWGAKSNSQDVIIDSDDGDGWYTGRDIDELKELKERKEDDDFVDEVDEEVRPFAMNLNLAKNVRELDDEDDDDDDYYWPGPSWSTGS